MTSVQTGYPFTDQIGHLLRRAYQRHVAIFKETVPDSQLTAAQFVVLCRLRNRAERTVPIAEQISELTFGDLKDDARKTLTVLLRKISGIDNA